jgi:alkylation response protein AidB-like acyl-CoA dehydrogenase
MIQDLRFESVPLPPAARRLRTRIRRFLAASLEGLTPLQRSAGWDGYDPAFSRRMGEAGFIGLTIPRRYGGQGRTALERYVVQEECLVAGAPTGFHWFADRQSGPLILRYGTEEQKRRILPALCRGELCFCIGMSEPGAGSDLAALRTQARRTDGGYIVNGTKLWTTNAHRAHYMIALVRTDEHAGGSAGTVNSRHAGFTQFLVDLKGSRGLTIRPVRDLHGREHFNEVVFQDTFLPDTAVIGTVGEGWTQVNAELALERSGPERYLSCHVLFTELLRVLKGSRSRQGSAVRIQLGEVLARLIALRSLSLSVAGRLAAGQDPLLEAAIVKDLGAAFEQSLPGIAQSLVDAEPTLDPEAEDFHQVLASMMMLAPSFSLRGGSVEVLRGIIARGLGLG